MPGRRSAAASADEALAWLKRRGTAKGLADQKRYGVVTAKAFGVGVGDVKKYSATIGHDHALAAALWATGWYEARLLAVFVEDPALVTKRQMADWAADFDNWGIVDTACFHLFDKTPHAWAMVARWAKAKPEFTKRTAFALVWSLSVHDKAATNAAFAGALRLIEAGAQDDRHFVKKAVNMALRAVGKRNAALHAAAVATARRLSTSPDAAPRWVGRDALRELERAAVRFRPRLDDR